MVWSLVAGILNHERPAKSHSECSDVLLDDYTTLGVSDSDCHDSRVNGLNLSHQACLSPRSIQRWQGAHRTNNKGCLQDKIQVLYIMIVCAQGLGLCQNAWGIFIEMKIIFSFPSWNFVRSGEVKSRDSCVEIWLKGCHAVNVQTRCRAS